MLVTCTRCEAHLDTGQAAAGEIVKCRCGLSIMVPECPVTAGKMACPACGAPVDPDHRTCEFCDTRLATVMCPSCFGVVFETAKHCEHCGSLLNAHKVIHAGDRTSHPCPRCNAHPVLRIEIVAGLPVERCLECDGLWIENDIVDKICREKERSQTIQAATAFERNATNSLQKPLVQEGYIPCPECGNLMNRHNFGRFSGVVIDICKGHGTWFDADELRRILQFIQEGGLEKKAQRERDELKDEIRKLRSQTGQFERNQSQAGMLNLSVGNTGRLASGAGALAVGGILRKLFGL